MMDMLIQPKSKRKPKKKKFKEEQDDLYDETSYHSSFDNGLLQKAVDTILYDDNSEHHVVHASPKLKQQKKKAAPWKEPGDVNMDELKFHKVAKPTTMRSIYWKYFGYPADMHGVIITKKKIICTLCGCQLCYSGNTTNIKTHLKNRHLMQYNQLELNAANNSFPPLKKRKDTSPEDMFTLVELTSTSSGVSVKPTKQNSYSICVQGEQGEEAIISIPHTHTGNNKKQARSTDKEILDLIVNFVILDLQPPSIVTSEGFRLLVSNLAPYASIPTAQNIIQDFVPKMYDTVKNAMYNDITAINMTDNVFSLALEHWEANERQYISYYINYLQNEENFETKLLHTFLLDQESANDTLYHQDMFNIVCTSWNIKISSIKAVILSSDNEALLQALVNQEIAVVPCLSHTLTQMCLTAFQIPSLHAVITKCRTVISQIYNKNNFAIEVTFQNQEEDDTSSTFLSLDNPNVWTSTLNMLEALNAARSKLNVLLELNDATQVENCESLCDDEWLIVSQVVDIFNPIKVTVTTLYEEKPARASLILPLYLQLVNYHLKIQLHDDAITTQLKTYFVEHLTRKISPADAFLQICTALDPRVKKLPYIEEHDVLGGAINNMLVAMEPPDSEVTKYYKDVVDTKKGRLSGMEFLLGNVTSTPTPPIKSSLPSHAENIAHEISVYHRTIPASLNQCPLMWWRAECNRFPNLYPLAVKYNCVPATCVPSKVLDMKSQCSYVEKRKLLSLNSQAVLNHLLFLHHNFK